MCKHETAANTVSSMLDIRFKSPICLRGNDAFLPGRSDIRVSGLAPLTSCGSTLHYYPGTNPHRVMRTQPRSKLYVNDVDELQFD